MRAVVQRVRSANVTVGGQVVGQIEAGLLVLLGISTSDTEREAIWIAQKIAKLRIFEGDDPAKGITNTVEDSQGSVLLVSQFTLYGSVKGNNRPSFIMAAPPAQAEPLYQLVGSQLGRLLSKPISFGVFGAMMDVASVNDGPFTVWIDTADDLPTGAKVVLV